MKKDAKTKDRIIRIAVLAAIAAALSAIPCAFFETHSLCVIYRLFHIRCFTCGVSAGFSHILHADFYAALEANRLVAVLFPLFSAVFISDVFSLIKGLAGKRTASLIERIFAFFVTGSVMNRSLREMSTR